MLLRSSVRNTHYKGRPLQSEKMETEKNTRNSGKIKGGDFFRIVFLSVCLQAS